MPKLSKKRLIYLAVFLLPFFIFLSNPNFVDPVRSRNLDALSLPLRILLFPFREIGKALTYHGTYTRYQKVVDELEQLKGALSRQRELVRENNLLRDALDLKKSSPDLIISSFVIGRDQNNLMTSLIIDKGSDQGVRAGMPVVTRRGVVGKVVQAGRGASQVMLLNDPGFRLAATVERTRESGLLGGTLNGICRLMYLDPETDIKIGDRVVASKLSSSFPEGYLIGEVITVGDSSDSPSKECLVKPFVNLSQLEIVFVVKK